MVHLKLYSKVFFQIGKLMLSFRSIISTTKIEGCAFDSDKELSNYKMLIHSLKIKINLFFRTTNQTSKFTLTIGNVEVDYMPPSLDKDIRLVKANACFT